MRHSSWIGYSATSSPKHSRVLLESSRKFANHMRLSPRCGMNETTDRADLLQSNFAILFVQVWCLSTNGGSSCIHDVVLDRLHPLWGMLRTLIGLNNTVLLMLESRRFTIGIVIFSQIDLRAGFLTSIILEEILWSIPKLIVKLLLLIIDVLNEVSSLMTFPIKEVGRLSHLRYWWRLLLRLSFSYELLDIVDLFVPHLFGLDGEVLIFALRREYIFEYFGEADIFSDWLTRIPRVDPIEIWRRHELSGLSVEIAPIDAGVLVQLTQTSIDTLNAFRVAMLELLVCQEPFWYHKLRATHVHFTSHEDRRGDWWKFGSVFVWQTRTIRSGVVSPLDIFQIGNWVVLTGRLDVNFGFRLLRSWIDCINIFSDRHRTLKYVVLPKPALNIVNFSGCLTILDKITTYVQNIVFLFIIHWRGRRLHNVDIEFPEYSQVHSSLRSCKIGLLALIICKSEYFILVNEISRLGETLWQLIYWGTSVSL